MNTDVLSRVPSLSIAIERKSIASSSEKAASLLCNCDRSSVNNCFVSKVPEEEVNEIIALNIPSSSIDKSNSLMPVICSPFKYTAVFSILPLLSIEMVLMTITN